MSESEKKPSYEELEQKIAEYESIMNMSAAPDSAAYDSAWRTEANDASHLLIPMVNEVFGERYTGNAKVIFSPNEHFLNRQDGETVRRITDTSFGIEEPSWEEQAVQPLLPGDTLEIVDENTPGSRKHFLFECESRTSNNRVLLRIFEYVAQIGLDQSRRMENGRLIVKIPRAAVIYLRSNGYTPDEMEITIMTEKGQVSTKVPAVKASDYSIDEIFEKKLFLLIPFFLFRYEKEFDRMEKDEKKLDELRAVYRDIEKRLDALVPEEDQEADIYGLVDEFTKRMLMDMCRKVAGKLAENYPKVRKGVESVMGGQILDYEAKRIKREGVKEGKKEGKKEGRKEGNEEGRAAEKKETARVLHGMNMDIDSIARAVRQPIDVVQSWLGLTQTP